MNENKLTRKLRFPPFLLSLNEDYLQILNGNFVHNGFKIESYSVCRTPLDLIKKGEIVELQKVAEIIRTMAEKSYPKKITKKDVCLSLSDEYVFTKFMTLPKVDEKEIESTLMYQVKDYLPYAENDLYFDWQRLPSKGESWQINVTAVKKTIIDQYFKALQLIDLHPVGFQPESTSFACLASLITHEPSLIINVSERKINFCFQEKGIVLIATTLFYQSEVNLMPMLNEELKKLSKYWEINFSPKKITTVFLAGKVENELIYQQTIKNSFDIEIKKLPLPVIINADFLKANLNRAIPLVGLAFSQAMAEQNCPRSGLIPKHIQKAKEEAVFFEYINKILKTTVVALWGLVTIFIYFYLSLVFEAKITQAALSGWEKVVYTPTQMQIEKAAMNFNQKITVFDQLVLLEKPSFLVLSRVQQLIPAGIKITELNFDAEKGIVELKGIANNREEILSLEKALSVLGEIQIPLSSFEKDDQPAFQLLIKLKEFKK